MTNPMTTQERTIEFQAKFYGQIYQVKPTKIITKHRKAHWDFNGYEVEASTEKSQQWGMFLNDDMIYTVRYFNRSYNVYSGSKCIGSISPLYEN